MEAFVCKYDAEGNLRRAKSRNAGLRGQNAGISADRLGNVYFAGSIISASNGPKEPSDDAFIGKYDDQGDLIWIKRLHATSWATGGAVSGRWSGKRVLLGKQWRLADELEAGHVCGQIRRRRNTALAPRIRIN